jgi:hypothetical protein
MCNFQPSFRDLTTTGLKPRPLKVKVLGFSPAVDLVSPESYRYYYRT